MQVYLCVIRLIFIIGVGSYIEASFTSYLLPENHPIKPILDEIFSKKRVLKNQISLKNAGFYNINPKAFTLIIVTTHPKLPGYIFKLYLDCQRHPCNAPIHVEWMDRINGAELVRNVLNPNYFKVPKKWIYRIPLTSSDLNQKDSILIEEDMELLPEKENQDRWKSVKPEILKMLYEILESTGLSDSAKPDNIPFSKDGKIAFVDTASYHDWPVAYWKLNCHLSNKTKRYWKRLTQ